MKYILMIGIFAISSNVLARDYGYKQQEHSYKSSAGTSYQYDTNNPADNIRYQTDINAQARDKNNSYKANPSRDILEDAYGQKGRYKGVLDD